MTNSPDTSQVAGNTSDSATPEFHLDTEGKVRYLRLRYLGLEFKERMPLHVYHMTDERRTFFVQQVGEKLKKQILKRVKGNL